MRTAGETGNSQYLCKGQEILTKLFLLLNGNAGYGIHHWHANFQYVELNRIPAPIPAAAEGIHEIHKRSQLFLLLPSNVLIRRLQDLAPQLQPPLSPSLFSESSLSILWPPTERQWNCSDWEPILALELGGKFRLMLRTDVSRLSVRRWFLAVKSSPVPDRVQAAKWGLIDETTL